MLKLGYYYNLYLISCRHLPHGYLDLNTCWGCFILVFYFTMPYTFLILYQSAPHVVIEASSCFSPFLLIVSSRILYILLIVIRYIVVDTDIYLYTLPINHLLTFFSSICLSCNLSQAWDHNTLPLINHSYHFGILLLTTTSLFSKCPYRHRPYPQTIFYTS